ncbi:MAG: glycosyl transferase [Ruminococcus sp.]|nr:glycosyl transferase [Ruminococcus sp.]
MNTRRKIAARILLILLLIGIGICAWPVCRGYGMYRDAVERKPLTQEVERIRSKPDYVSIEELPEIYKEAVVSVEDHRFYSHFGIDPVAVVRAMINNIKYVCLREGGSGIPQQLSKNLYFTKEKTFTRKMAEVFLSLDLEREYTKDEILELYVNTIYFGEDYYGVKAASIGYFGKMPEKLDSCESTLLAGIPNAPEIYAPTEHPELAYERQRQVLSTMVEHGYLTEEEAAEITAGAE